MTDKQEVTEGSTVYYHGADHEQGFYTVSHISRHRYYVDLVRILKDRLDKFGGISIGDVTVVPVPDLPELRPGYYVQSTIHTKNVDRYILNSAEEWLWIDPITFEVVPLSKGVLPTHPLRDLKRVDGW
jgi:hypothetical protein